MQGVIDLLRKNHVATLFVGPITSISAQSCNSYRYQTFDLYSKSNDLLLYEMYHWAEMCLLANPMASKLDKKVQCKFILRGKAFILKSHIGMGVLL